MICYDGLSSFNPHGDSITLEEACVREMKTLLLSCAKLASHSNFDVWMGDGGVGLISGYEI